MTFKVEFGKRIPGLKIRGELAPYRVLNERDARAAAGIMLIIGIFAFVSALILRNFFPLKIVVVLFFIEFLVRVFVNPHYAPLYALGHLLVSNQLPEWSGAVQKRFAWTLGIIMAGSMIPVALVFEMRGIVPFSICSVCLILLWAESALGVCIGCKIYSTLVKRNVIQPKIMPACPGGVCELTTTNPYKDKESEDMS